MLQVLHRIVKYNKNDFIVHIQKRLRFCVLFQHEKMSF